MAVVGGVNVLDAVGIGGSSPLGRFARFVLRRYSRNAPTITTSKMSKMNGPPRRK